MADTTTDPQKGWEPAAIPTDTFGQRLRLIRFVLDENVTGIAKLIGVPAATWTTWEEGASPRNVQDIVRRVVDATHERFAPEAPASAMRDWLIWGPMSRCITGHPGQGHLFDLPSLCAPTILVAA